MRMRPSDRGVLVEAPAKVNLFLEVMDRRPDGFHEIATVIQELDLADTLEAEASDDFSLETDGLPIPPGGENLVLKAARLLSEEAGARAAAAFRLRKRIPAGAGLGGGSSDAAAALAACAALWKLGASREDLARVAARVGSDVPYFLTGGTALCTGRGEAVAPLPPAPAMALHLVWPGIALATRAVYAAHAASRQGPRRDAQAFVRLLEAGAPAVLARGLHNRLEGAAFSVKPELSEVKAFMATSGFLGFSMSGSGSAFFGILPEGEGEPRARPIPRGWMAFRTMIPPSSP